ncbi:MAG: C40 family peptidase [Bacteroides sp.]|nr:C40 family peptidase [Bacteroides sp.]MCM1361768.1 C40 family peptidase [Clostridiales bacterium]
MTKVEYAVQWAIAIANDDSHGYDQGNRWGPDYDCSSLIITAYENAGIPVKSNGATRTYDMKSVFLRTGFVEVKSWNKSTGAGLQRGDVVLNVSHHVELYIGDGKLLKASQNEFGGSIGGKVGDQTGTEIKIGGYYNFPWDCALRYAGVDDYTGGKSSLCTTAADYAITGMIAEVNPDYREIDNYIITLDRNSSDADYNKLKKLGVVAVMIEEGCLYDVTHKEKETYVNPKIDSQVSAAVKNNMPYGLYSDVKAQSVAEANRELSWLRIYASKYIPPLGIWLTLNLTKSKAVNDMIIDRYRTVLNGAGFHGKMGFYVTRQQLGKITWSKWKDDFLLLLVDHVSDISEIETILTPEFFMLKKK